MSYHKRGKLIQGYTCRTHPLYSTWSAMKDRCYNKKAKQYTDYGGRGIFVCSSWKDSFETFALDLGLKPDSTYALERRDNNKGYSKENCYWATRSENNQNKRVYKSSKTGYSGIRLTKSGTYSVRQLNTRTILGCFHTLEEAISAQKENLTQNKPRINNTTGFIGITIDKNGKYIVRKNINGKRVYLGYRASLELAKELYENC